MRSEFDSPVKVIAGQVLPGGDFSHGGMTAFSLTRAKAALTWLIEQDGKVASSTMVLEETATTWHDSAFVPPEWHEGPARAIATVSIVSTDGVTTFSWQDDVVLDYD